MLNHHKRARTEQEVRKSRGSKPLQRATERATERATDRAKGQRATDHGETAAPTEQEGVAGGGRCEAPGDRIVVGTPPER